MKLNEDEVFFLSQKNRSYYRGEKKVPSGWSGQADMMIMLTLLPYGAWVAYLVSRQKISFEVSIALLVAFPMFCLVRGFLLYRRAIHIFSEPDFYFTRDFEMTWFDHSDPISCEAIFTFHDPTTFRSRKYGGNISINFKEGMNLCAVYLGQGKFYIL